MRRRYSLNVRGKLGAARKGAGLDIANPIEDIAYTTAGFNSEIPNYSN